jgi:hypothetical protein
MSMAWTATATGSRARAESDNPAVERAFVSTEPSISSGSRHNHRSEEDAARWQQRFELPMLVAAALVIPSLLLEQPGVADPWHAVGVALNWVIWAAFLFELVVMLAVSPNRWSYLRHNRSTS